MLISRNIFKTIFHIQDDSKLLSGVRWSINGNPDNDLESACIFLKLMFYMHFQYTGPPLKIDNIMKELKIQSVQKGINTVKFG
jgi:hypothetical protein